MFAVIKTGGKQYKVAKDEVVLVEKLVGAAGERIRFDEVILVSGEGSKLSVGNPTVAGAAVIGTVVEQTRGPKIIVFKKKRRHNYRRKNGHRQDLTAVRIGEILTDGAEPSAQAAAPEGKPAKAKARKAPAKKAVETSEE